MEAVAKTKYIRVSPRKVRQVLPLISGRSVEDALNILYFTQKSASEPLAKTIRSAFANLSNIDENKRFDMHEAKIKNAYVDAGPTLKRFRPMSMGRAGRIRKRTSHITVVVEYSD